MHPVAEERRLCRLDIFRVDAAAVDHDTDVHPLASRRPRLGSQEDLCDP
jgi:hypothetical protein